MKPSALFASFCRCVVRDSVASPTLAQAHLNIIATASHKLCFDTRMQFVWRVQNIVVIGLTQAGERMSDPYGDDEVDLPARQYVASTLKNSRRLLEASPQVEAPSKESEEAVLDNDAAADEATSEEEDDDIGNSPKPMRRSGSGRSMGIGGSGRKMGSGGSKRNLTGKGGSGRKLGV